MAQAEPSSEERPPQAGFLSGTALAAALLAVAGFVDATAFLRFGGLYASFMSGDTTQLGLSVAGGKLAAALRLGAVIALFTAGAAFGRLLARGTGRRRRPAVLGALAGLLALAAVSGSLGAGGAALILMVFAMGLQNAVIHAASGVSLTLTFVTGTLVRLGESLADLALGGALRKPLAYGALWAGLATGATGGALCYQRFGVAALVAPALVAAGLSMGLARRDSLRGEGRPS